MRHLLRIIFLLLPAFLSAQTRESRSGEIRSFSGGIKIRMPKDWHTAIEESYKGERGYDNSKVRGNNWCFSFGFEFISDVKLPLMINLLEKHQLPQVLGLSDWMDVGNYEIVKPTVIPEIIEVKYIDDIPEIKQWGIYLFEMGGGVIIVNLHVTAGNGAVDLEKNKMSVVDELYKIFYNSKKILKENGIDHARLDRKWIKIPTDLLTSYASIYRVPIVARNLEKIKKQPAIFIDMNASWEIYLENAWGLRGNSKLSKYFNSNGIDEPKRMVEIIIRGFLNHIYSKPSDIQAVNDELTALIAVGKNPYSPYFDDYRPPQTIAEIVERKRALQ